MPRDPKQPTLCLRFALLYADSIRSYGWKTFPARMDKGKKYSYLSRKHAPEKLNWGMTSNPEQLIKNFSNPLWRNRCGVGLPTGLVNGIFVLEFDTIKGHGVDGAASLRRMESEHGRLPRTLMSQSPSGSTHRFFKHPGAHLKVKSVDSVAGYDGVDVKGDGGMVIAPPSHRHDGDYVWLNDEEIADAPDWLVKLVTDDARPMADAVDIDDEFMEMYHDQNPSAPIKEVCAALAAIPNDDVSWDEWNRIGMAIFANSPDSDGLNAFDEWSQKSCKYDKRATAAKWRAFSGSPPDSINVGTLFYLASEYDSDWRDHIEDDEDNASKINGDASKLNGHDASSMLHQDSDDSPVDLWDQHAVPDLPRGLLPKLIEEFAFQHSAIMACDPAGLAVGALTVCAGVIPDTIKLQPDPFNTRWTEAPRLWSALVGDVAMKKTPIFEMVLHPAFSLEAALRQQNSMAMLAYEALPKEDRDLQVKPIEQRLMISDATIERVQELMRDNPSGMLMSRDELSGWFGNMEKYNNARGQGDRAFWLESFQGKPYISDRIKRGSVFIPNNSLSLFGTIQPSIMRKLADDIPVDGLIQRLIPIMLRKMMRTGQKQVMTAQAYDALVNELFELRSMTGDTLLMFEDKAVVVFNDVMQQNEELVQSEFYDERLRGHFRKYDGIFARLCVIWHCIECAGSLVKHRIISGNVAQRVRDFMDKFLRPHALCFYANVLGLSSEHDRMLKIANYVLALGLKEVTARDIQKSNPHSMRGLARRDIELLCDHLIGCGWLRRAMANRSNSSKWTVVPVVHSLFRDRAETEKQRRKEHAKRFES